MAFRVLASDPLDASAVAAMRGAGLTVDEKTDLSPDQLKAEIAAYDAIVVRSATKVRAPIIDAAKNLKLIVRAGVAVCRFLRQHGYRQEACQGDGHS